MNAQNRINSLNECFCKVNYYIFTIGVAAAPAIILAGAISKILANPPAGVVPRFGNGSNSSGPMGFEYNGKYYSREEFVVIVGCSLTCLIGLIQFLMGIRVQYISVHSIN